MNEVTFRDCSKVILNECVQVLSLVEEAEISRLIGEILAAEKVFVFGVGRVMLSMQAFAKRLNHIGIETHCVGDINEPAITAEDLIIIGSGSGQTVLPLAIAEKAKSLGAKVAHIGSLPQSEMAGIRDLFVRIPSQTKLGLPDEVTSVQPMTSLFEQALLLVADTVCSEIIQMKNIKMSDLWKYHANLE